MWGYLKMSNSFKLSLDRNLDISKSEKLKLELINAINKSVDVEIDSSMVDRITTPCIQLIVLADHELSQSNNRLFVSNPSDVFEKAFQDIGLTDMLESWRM